MVAGAIWVKIEDFVPCPDGTFLGVEGKLGDADIQDLLPLRAKCVNTIW